MSLLQLNIDSALKKAIKAKADEYGVPASSLARIALVNAFLKYDWCPPPARKAAATQQMTLDQFIMMSGGPREVDDDEYEKSAHELANAISQKFRNKKLPPIEEQLKNL